MTERNRTIPGVRNVARRRETIFRKCHELSKFGVGIWVVICTGARDTMFKSSNTALFEQLDRQLIRVSRRPVWKYSSDYDRLLRGDRRLRLIDRLR
ncbi:hypothetical protein M752DRAFT_319837 [Aspergillus phoenicis ATCC 13157]|uniref:MADS-box domain-containing protein n=1 Tax=Aspergillus phoenicis ATCC 13157 TaxID=1353007 RepID=A0A370PFT5_ASPPH|nr:hypothetical protein M752DRAFT_319837 [Aspergillus phoenicis ATCC 13157]